jgi:hypothetical protein
MNSVNGVEFVVAVTDRTYIAVDPGASGAIAWADREGGGVVPMPETRRGCIEAIRRILKLSVSGDPVAYVEKISGFIPDGGASQMFEFGKSVERVSCILETLGVRIIEITPQAWQKTLSLGKAERMKALPGMSDEQKKAVKTHNSGVKRDWKRKLQAEAERRFPGQRVTLKTCDALLLLDVAIKNESGRLL